VEVVIATLLPAEALAVMVSLVAEVMTLAAPMRTIAAALTPLDAVAVASTLAGILAPCPRLIAMLPISPGRDCRY
jgi:hypothetical protein